jgi:MSHA biogenesis protein MshN
LELIESAICAADVDRATVCVLRVETLLDRDERTAFRSRIAAQSEHFSNADKHVQVASQTSKKIFESQGAELNVPLSDGSISISRSTEQQIQTQLNYVRALINSKNTAAALQDMAHIYSAYPARPDVRSLYFDMLLNVKEYQLLADLVDEQALPSELFYKAKSIQYLQGDTFAMNFLEQNKPEDLKSLSLLAGLQQKYQRYHRAITSYKKLVDIDVNNGRYWLGLGVSYDAIGNRDEAYRAYLNVGAGADLEKSVRSFVSSRIRALASAQNDLELSQW